MTALVSTATIGLRESRAWGVTVRKDEFLKSYVNAVRSLARTLDGFLESPDVRALHEVRTAIRRFDAHVELLPGRIRKSPEVQELLRKHRRVMKKSAKVRDLYVIRAKVERCPQDYLAARLLKKIDKRRRDLVKEMKDGVASARKLAPPTVESGDLLQAKLDVRFSKVTGALTQTINSLLPDVATDPNLVTALRRLRIDSTRLRYILELAPKADSAKVLAFSEDWHDALGAIHDWDVTIACLQEFDNPVAEELLMAGVRERVREFRAFAKSVLNPA